MEIKFIAQFNCELSGTICSEIRDVLLINNKLYVYCRRANNTFELIIVDKNDYNKNEFERFLIDPSRISSDCNIIFGWRAHIVAEPKYLPEEYYIHIHQLDVRHTINFKNNKLFFQKELNKFVSTIKEFGF
jgi:hypothetical protein